MLEINQLSKSVGEKIILDKLEIRLPIGRSLAVVGESGSGKSTLAKMIMALARPTSGSISFDGVVAPQHKTSDFKAWYRQIQLVFQNTAASLDPRMTIMQSIEEPLRYFTKLGKSDRKQLAAEYADLVGLPSLLLTSLPNQLSGGQYQRACIAKALILKPKLLVCDEIVSNLDVIHQHKIIKLLQKLREEQKLSLVFITHDLSLVTSLCDQIMVMKNGRMVELFNSETLHSKDRHPYTRSLLETARLISRRNDD
ncbi:hypothetical protein BK133_27515 [Paenibacillus sp. FSL H8-0548]|uniref:ABC transporter ATP-binding protein n=1 Tax=Paenibacillus sp. FSL H8-0548 TaxID=1920422 RepID=UPI00096E1CB6|nr:ATP-binding cassette domain-containing protein [Paenibacillus sp. FSL H8-0548]OMF21919.1 hypothetical protein BK133_27515 [Paenibacillus sp. FSL H8-0548]